MTPSPSTRIAAVVIGRNEGRRLLECIDSIRPHVADIVYVDSGSTDGSPQQAEAAGARCIRLESGPFTAARGRQAGVGALDAKSPEFILFIDGDCTLDPGFLGAAMAHMASHPRTGAVAGRRREAGTNFWSRVIDIEWDTTPGIVAHVGGDSLMRAASIREAGGWPVDVIAGEEPDLCLRMKDRGWDSVRIPVEMTLHDIRMTRLSQFWKRSVRAGHAYAEVAWRRSRAGRAEQVRPVLSITAYGAALPLCMLAAAIVYWPLAVVVALMYVRLIGAVAVRTRRRGRAGSLALAYAALTAIGKLAGFLGVLRFAFGVATGRRSRIIEYQASQSPSNSRPFGAGPERKSV